MMNIQAVKSLTYRRFCLIRKNSTAILLTGFLLLFLGWAILLSMQIGNLKNVYDSPEEKKSAADTMAMLLNVAVPILMATMTSDRIVFSSDIKCRWREYSIATPMTWKENAASSLLLFFSGIGIALAASFVNLGVIIAVSGIEFKATMVYSIFAAIDAVMLMSLFMDPVLIRARTEKQLNLSLNFIAFAVIAVGVVIAIFASKIENELRALSKIAPTELAEKLQDWMDKYMYIAVIVFFAIIALKIAINVICYGKEKRI